MSTSKFVIGYIKAFTDNYIWYVQYGKEIILIDPGQSANVLNYITNNDLQLSAILLTHDHNDHIGGVDDILKIFPVPVYGNCSKSSILVNNGEVIKLFQNIEAKIIYTKGHTSNSICFLLNINSIPHLFCGDTLFAMGCGRVFTNDYQAMFNSLNQIINLPAQTIIYPAHEYTMANIEFAKFIEPNNILILERELDERNKLKQLGNTLPISLNDELKTNQFLRFNDEKLISALAKKLNKTINSGFDCFYQLRQLKNNF
jgi:hydroxyacylglutathione hydrolase